MTERPSPVAGLAAFMVSIVGVFASNSMVSLLYPLIMPLGQVGVFVYLIVYQVALFMVPTLLYYRSAPALRPALRIARLDLLNVVLIILAAIVGLFALNMLSSLWLALLQSLGLTISSGNASAPSTPQALAQMLVFSALMPAICEELLCRGLLLPSLEPLGERKAIVLSGLLFAMVHGRIEAFPSHFLLGIVLAVVVLRTGSLLASILMHVVYNGAILVITYVTDAARIALEEQAAGITTVYSIDPQSVLMTVVLLGIWLLLVVSISSRGEKKQRNPLPPATRKPLPLLAKVLLAACFVALIYLEVTAVLAMLPGAGA